MSAQLDMIWPPLTALALYRASGSASSSGTGYTKTPFLTKFLETVTYAPFCALFAAGAGGSNVDPPPPVSSPEKITGTDTALIVCVAVFGTAAIGLAASTIMTQRRLQSERLKKVSQSQGSASDVRVSIQQQHSSAFALDSSATTSATVSRLGVRARGFGSGPVSVRV